MSVRRLQVESRSDVGLVREHNEDALRVAEDCGLIVVADGMGGCAAGEEASRIAVDTVTQQMRERSAGDLLPVEYRLALEHSIETANSAILEAAKGRPELSGMGTTVVAGMFRNNTLFVSHIGDSRVYRLRGGTLIQLTVDHSIVQQLVNQGVFPSLHEAIEAGVPSNVLTRALGAESPASAQVASYEARFGDIYLFCTDGLTNMVSDHHLESVIDAADRDLGGAADRLVEMARSNGGLDNITLVLARPLN